MQRNSSVVSSWGMYVPERVLSNAELETMVDTSDAWIRSRTGIRERRVAAEHETCSMMAVAAARQALAHRNLPPKALDLILVATNSPEYIVPSVSSLIQDQLGAACPALTVVTGCTGFVYSLITAHQFIASGACQHILIVGVDVITRFIDWTDRNTCVLFGDGAGAVILSNSETKTGFLAFDFGSDGEKGKDLIIPGFGSAHKMDHQLIAAGKQYLTMNGREIFKFATTQVPKSIERVLEKTGLSVSEIDLFIPHQANVRIIERVGRHFGLTPEKMVVNIDRYGNTSAASIPIALCEAVAAGRLRTGDHLCLISFGAGLTWASVILKWLL